MSDDRGREMLNMMNRAKQANRDFEQELLHGIGQENGRYRRGIQDADRLADIQQQIDRLRKHGGDDATEPLKRLGKAHYDLIGTAGGADGARPSTADRTRAARQNVDQDVALTSGLKI